MTTFFNDLGKLLSQTGQEAVRKAREIAGSTRYTAQIACEEHRIAEIFEQIGRNAYNMSKGEATDSEKMAELITQVDECNKRIASLKEMIERAKENYECPSCETSGQAGPFCSNCGAKIEEALAKAREEQARKEKEALESMVFCESCGALLDNGDLYCSGCGTKVCKDEKPEEPAE